MKKKKSKTLKATVTNEITKEEIDNILSQILDDFLDRTTLQMFQYLKEKGELKEAVLLMHPMHKRMMAESGLDIHILWSDCCEKDKAYIFRDEYVYDNIKITTSIYDGK